MPDISEANGGPGQGHGRDRRHAALSPAPSPQQPPAEAQRWICSSRSHRTLRSRPAPRSGRRRRCSRSCGACNRPYKVAAFRTARDRSVGRLSHVAFLATGSRRSLASSRRRNCKILQTLSSCFRGSSCPLWIAVFHCNTAFGLKQPDTARVPIRARSIRHIGVRRFPDIAGVSKCERRFATARALFFRTPDSCRLTSAR